MAKKFWIFLIIAISFFIVLFAFPELFGGAVSYSKSAQSIDAIQNQNKVIVPVVPPLDLVAYDKKLNEMANNPIPKVITPQKDKDGNEIPAPVVPPKPTLWPVKTVYPNAGAILPFNRIIAYYGNLYSTKMGVLGEYPEAIMLAKLKEEVKKWEEADPGTPVIPALHYIAVVAQAGAGQDGKYRARMPDIEIDKVLAMAAKINAIVFLDIQVGFSTIEAEVPLLEKYLKMPQVHLALDPEFSMKGTIRPGKVVGTLDASDINFASNYLASLVKKNNLTPKILMVHRYTQKMVTNYKQIKTLPEVQIVMDMDGWGGQAKKINTYQQFIYKEPVQFTGFKLFYKNDIWEKGTVLMSPSTLLKLNPRPVYIQFQ
ncbi:MAG: hypothetical protein WC870_00030 [Candidatus Paceibacterota bacterium]